MRAFVPNPGFPEEFARDPEVQGRLAGLIEPVRAEAEASGPRIMPSGSQAFEVRTSDGAVYLINTDHGGHLAEWGSIHNPPYAPLRRAILASGLRLEETS